MNGRRTAVRRTLLILAVLALVWAAIIAITGGVGVTVAGIRVSSRNPYNPLLIALLSACAVAALSRRRADDLARDLRWLTALLATAGTAYRHRR
jgi:hypothetical protein